MGRKKWIRVVDDEVVLSRRLGSKLREEVWEDENGTVMKYNLAYINPAVCRVDNGRVLGYDSAHGHHHRHFMGTVEPIEFKSYTSLAERFSQEVNQLRREGK